ncbi:MAG: M1 family metallopeptidase [Bryobacteraceae bacterium]
MILAAWLESQAIGGIIHCMRRWAWLCVAVSLTADTYPRQAGVDAEHYAFRIGLSDTSDEIRGEARVDVRRLRDGVHALFLDFASGMSVDGVAADGTALAFEHRAERLRISLPPAGARLSVTVRYHGVPASGLRIGPNQHGDRTFFSLNWPDKARGWLPMIDHPYDKATSEFFITAPARYQVVANGALQEETDLGNGRRVTHWKESVPIASWLNAIAVAQFSVRHFGTAKGIELSNWVYRQDREMGVSTLDVATRNAVEFLSDFVGPYPFEKLANVQAAGFAGGMEHASVIFYGEKTVTAKPSATLVAHEVAHQWFGNSVTESDWDDLWLSEGFATYFALLCVERMEGRDAFVSGLKRSRTTILNLEAKLPSTAVIHANLADMKKIANGLIYQKGAWTLHMLRGLIGMEAFRNGMRDYYQRYRGRNATTADFQRVMEEHSGVELGWFLDQWLRRPGTPAIEGTWSYDAGAKQVQIALRQTQPGGVYRLPLEFGLDGDRVERVEMKTREERFVIGAGKEPSAVRMDPNMWTLATETFQKH